MVMIKHGGKRKKREEAKARNIGNKGRERKGFQEDKRQMNRDRDRDTQSVAKRAIGMLESEREA